MEKIITLIVLMIISLGIIYLAKKFEQRTWFRRIDRFIGIPIILLLLSWGVFEIVSGAASFFFINLKPLYNTSREQAPFLYWFYVLLKFFLAFIFAVRVKQLYGKRTY